MSSVTESAHIHFPVLTAGDSSCEVAARAILMLGFGSVWSKTADVVRQFPAGSRILCLLQAAYVHHQIMKHGR